jgi:ABC-type branched-subunit amino acid transport system ATPase component
MPPDAAPLLNAAGVEAGYGTMQVLWGVDLDVRAGETVLLLGANGAGKTTFLKSLVGLVEPRRGSIRLAGEDITHMRSSDRMRLGMTYMSELAVFPDLSTRKPAPTSSMACSRCCVTSAAMRPRASPAGSEKCSALPRRSPPSRSCW